jgi:small Trp-rich protein
MPFVWIGLVAVIMKWTEFGPLATVSWWWILSPLVVAIVWFEVIQPALGLDKKADDGKAAADKKARIARSFEKNKRA